jgi:H3 lysine-79-specific histone-lysine N-methyltransferase
VEFDKDSDGDDDDWVNAIDARKRQRRGTSEGRFVDFSRSLRQEGAFGEDGERLLFVHAADVASLALNCVPVLGAAEEEVAVELQYPSLQPRERFLLKRDPMVGGSG